MRTPTLSDGARMWALARDSGTLDTNSPYCYFLLGGHFSETCVVAESGGRPAGMLAAYRKPSQPDTLFIWQIAVAQAHRGFGLGRGMLAWITRRTGVVAVEASVTPSNEASWRLFGSFAKGVGARLGDRPWIAAEQFPGPCHEPEKLISIQLAGAGIMAGAEPNYPPQEGCPQ